MIFLMLFYSFASDPVFLDTTVTTNTLECNNKLYHLKGKTLKLNEYISSTEKILLACGTVITDDLEEKAYNYLTKVKSEYNQKKKKGTIENLDFIRWKKGIKSSILDLYNSTNDYKKDKNIKELNLLGSQCLVNFCFTQAEEKNQVGNLELYASHLKKNANIVKRCGQSTCRYDLKECRSDKLQYPISKNMCLLKKTMMGFGSFAVFDTDEIEDVLEDSGYEELGGKWVSPEESKSEARSYTPYTRGSN